jgi:hypothetical protein
MFSRCPSMTRNEIARISPKKKYNVSIIEAGCRIHRHYRKNNGGKHLCGAFFRGMYSTPGKSQSWWQVYLRGLVFRFLYSANYRWTLPGRAVALLIRGILR